VERGFFRKIERLSSVKIETFDNSNLGHTKNLRRFFAGALNKTLRYLSLENALFLILAIFFVLTILSFLKIGSVLFEFFNEVQLILVVVTATLWIIIYFLRKRD